MPFQPTHGQSRTRLYTTWQDMLARCRTPTHRWYPNYGGRGISVCPEWRSFPGFADWALANGYADDLTIDRVDNDGDYEPGNCQWITRSANVVKMPFSTPNATLTEDDVRAIRAALAAGESQRHVAARFGVSQPTISHIASGKSWGHVL